LSIFSSFILFIPAGGRNVRKKLETTKCMHEKGKIIFLGISRRGWREKASLSLLAQVESYESESYFHFTEWRLD